MERGPYERWPGETGDPRRDPAYAPPPEYYEPPPRRIGFAEVVALLALVGAIVGIVLAIDAREQGSDDEQIAREVRQETQRNIRQVRAAVREKAGSVGARARQAETEAKQTREAVAEMRKQLSRLQTEVSTLKSQQNQVRKTLQGQSEAIGELRRKPRE